MQDVPKIVLKRLRETALRDAHPDADLLTAFVERSLGKSERAAVVEHLARCADCRDGIAFALPAYEEVGVHPLRRDARKQWLGWSAVRWGMMAAAILLVASIGVLQFKQGQSRNKVANSTLAARNELPANAAYSKVEPDGGPSSANQTKTLSNPKKLSPDVPGHSSNANVVGPQTIDSAGFRHARQSTRRKVPAPTPESRDALTAGSHMSATQPAEVATAAQNQIPDQLIQNQNDQSASRPYASSDVVKAKPLVPIQDMSNQPSSPGSAETLPRWSISSVGALQRSFDGGTTWEGVIIDSSVAKGSPTAKLSPGDAEASLKGETQPRVVFRAVAAIASDVWVGGEGSLVYHSSDSGIHWQRVLPSSAAAMLSGDIIRIEFSDSQRGSITTSNGEVWITTDGGRTWRRQ